MNLAELRAKMKAALKELTELRDKEQRSADDEARIDALLAEVNDLGPQITRAQAVEAATSQLADYTESRGRVSASQPDAGETTADLRSIGERFTDSDAFRAYAQYGGRQSEAVQLGGLVDQRAVVHTGALPSQMILPTQVPGIFRGMDKALRVRDVLGGGSTTSDSIVYLSETTFTNSAAEVAQATSATTGTKPESGIEFEQATDPIVTIAHWIPITRQTIQDVPQLQSYINGRLLDGLAQREDAQLLNGAGTGATLKGLTKRTGVQALDVTYFTSAPVAGAGTIRENFDRILRAKSKISTVGRALASFVVLNPQDHEAFQSLADDVGRYYGTGPFTAGLVPTLWGLPVVLSENQTAGKAVVGDGRMAAVWDRMQGQIMVDTVNDQFIKNQLTILAEERVGLAVYRASAFASVTLAAVPVPAPSGG